MRIFGFLCMANNVDRLRPHGNTIVLFLTGLSTNIINIHCASRGVLGAIDSGEMRKAD
jgi:hypothetical protein